MVRARLAHQTESGSKKIQDFAHPFIDRENPVMARQEAFSRYMSYLDVIGETGDQEKN